MRSCSNGGGEGGPILLNWGYSDGGGENPVAETETPSFLAAPAGTAPPASKPVLIAVDDDPNVLKAVVRDLRGHYASRYRIVAAGSGEAALEALGEIASRNNGAGAELVALLLADQRMPGMCGTDFLEAAKEIAPSAKRVLLTAYADTDAAISAINDAQINHYLLKPWDPPEDKLYPVLDDLLDDWQAGFRPPFEGIQLFGVRFSPATHAVKDFLGRQQIPYQWVDVEQAREGAGKGDLPSQRLLELLGADAACLPVVVFPDGTRLVQPLPTAIAEKLGFRTRAERPFYDLVIIGGGPAGLAAAVYAGSEGLSTLIVEQEAAGGQAGTSSRIENYLGFPSGVSGADLARRAHTQALRFGVEILAPTEAEAVRIEGPYRVVTLAGCGEVSCHALLIATGVSWRTLSDIAAVDRFTGAGLYYGAAMTEALAVKGEDIYIIGGANSAGQAAMHFAKYARRVTMLVRSDDLRNGMSDYLVEQIGGTPNITVRTQTRMTGIGGDERLQTITITDDATNEEETVPTGSVFIFIGAVPRTDWVGGLLARDAQGFLLTGPDLPRDGRTGRPEGWPLPRDPFLLETNVPGIYVAGDVRHGSIKRIAAGVGEGGVAVSAIHRYLASVR
ncbi:MAG: FAD-dependent oxidoreductase [Cytophagales bacterium]|nr:FAD-dependent oxidoreductase [Armatimonadota bacterium]